LTATWRKQPSIAERFRHSPPKSYADHTCRRCDTVIPDGLHYCPTHYRELSDVQRDNLRRIYHPRRA